MAQSASTGFFFKKNLRPGVEKPATARFLIANSEGPLTVGDAVQLTSGYLTIAATGESIIGILEGFETANGENIFKTNESLGGTLSGDDTYTAASDNATVDQVVGVVVVDEDALFLNQADSSLTQAEVGLYFDTTSASDQITGAGSGTISQFQLIDLVTTDSTGASANDLGLFRISQTQLGWSAT